LVSFAIQNIKNKADKGGGIEVMYWLLRVWQKNKVSLFKELK